MFPSRPYILALPDATSAKSTGDDYLSHVTGYGDDMMAMDFNFRQWQGTFESVLIRKAAGLYSDLASLAEAECTYGLALRYIRLSLALLSSYKNLEWVNSSQEWDLLPTVLCCAGDVLVSMAKSCDLEACLAASKVDYLEADEFDRYFDEHCRIGGDDPHHRLDVQFIPDVEKLLRNRLELLKLDDFTLTT